MKSLIGTIALIFLCAITCGATFLFALYRQLALVEVAASMATMVEVYMLSSSIGDLIEKKMSINIVRVTIAIVLAVLILAYYLISKKLHS